MRLPVHATWPHTLGDIERAHILAVLEDCNGNQTQAAEVLDIDRFTLHNKQKNVSGGELFRKHRELHSAIAVGVLSS